MNEEKKCGVCLNYNSTHCPYPSQRRQFDLAGECSSFAFFVILKQTDVEKLQAQNKIMRDALLQIEEEKDGFQCNCIASMVIEKVEGLK